MRFNYQKFREDTNNSSTYAQWSRHLMEALEKAGDTHPTYDYREHIFTIRIGRPLTESGRRRRGVSVKVICSDEGEIRIEPDKKLKSEEISTAIEKVINFLLVMGCAGYISLCEEESNCSTIS